MPGGRQFFIEMVWPGLTSFGGWLLHPVGEWVTEKLLAPAVVAVVFSGLTNIVIERLKAKRDQATKLCDGLRTDLAELQKLSGDYWSRKGKAGDALIEAKVLALQSEVLATVGLLADEFGLEISDDGTLASMADALTGGDFESATRAVDADRLKASSALLSAVRTRVTTERWKRMKRTGW